MGGTSRREGALTQGEIERVIMATLAGMGKADKGTLQRAVEWAENARIDETMLRMVLAGQVALNVTPDDIEFRLIEGAR